MASVICISAAPSDQVASAAQASTCDCARAEHESKRSPNAVNFPTVLIKPSPGFLFCLEGKLSTEAVAVKCHIRWDGTLDSGGTAHSSDHAVIAACDYKFTTSYCCAHINLFSLRIIFFLYSFCTRLKYKPNSTIRSPLAKNL